ncbi:hypothetical protein D3C86_2180850 [compost metagenome]
MTHCVPISGVAQAPGTGPLVKSTLPTMVVVFSEPSALATLPLSFGLVLAFKASKPASSSDMGAPSCWFHCLLAAFS